MTSNNGPVDPRRAAGGPVVGPVGTPPAKQPVRSLTNPSPHGMPPAEMHGARDPFAQLMMDAGDRVANGDTLVLELINQIRTYEMELAALRAVLIRRGLVSEAELSAMRRMIADAADQELRRMVDQMQRQQQQRPIGG